MNRLNGQLRLLSIGRSSGGSLNLTPNVPVTRGYVPLSISDIRSIRNGEIRLGIIRKENEPDPDYLEITGISPETAEGFATIFAARAGLPIEAPQHRARVRAEKERLGRERAVRQTAE